MARGLSFSEFMTHRATLAAEAVVAAFVPLLYYACRTSAHVYIDIYSFDGASQMIFWFMVADAIGVLAIAFLRWRTERFGGESLPKAYTACAVAAFFLTVVFMIVDFVMLGIMGSESSPIAGRELAKLLPYALGYYAAIFFALFFPAVKGRKARVAVASVTLTVGILGLLFSIYPPIHYEFLAPPMVIDDGGGYSVVFATSAPGTGFIEYEYEGREYKVYDEVTGRIKGSTVVHSVRVPYEHLNGNDYRVGSMRVLEEYAYGSRTGRTITSETYTFTPCTGEEQTYLCISDWHILNGRALDAVEKVGDYDAVLYLGDGLPELQREVEAAEYIVKFGGDISGGEMPVVYLRGNHETRGAYASELAGMLKMEEFYYEAEMGDYRIIVLDSGDDKNDYHPEYGGLADYAAYREEMADWLDGLEEDGRKTIALSHSPAVGLNHGIYVDEPEDELRARIFGRLEELGVSLLIGGHVHECYLNLNDGSGEMIGDLYLCGDGLSYEDDTSTNGAGIPVYVDGGYVHLEDLFVASRVTLSPDGIDLFAVSEEGDVVFEYTLPW